MPFLRRLCCLAALLWLLPAFAAPVRADSAQAATPQVRARLLAAVDTVHPGEEVLLGVRQQIIPHWHTYWINPGDSGIATTIDWKLPPGATAGPIQWPVPSRFQLGPITNFGYADEVTLLVSIHVPADATPGSDFPIRATVDWLVCQEDCIPQQVELGLHLPVTAAGTTPRPGNPLIEAARARLPVATPSGTILDPEGTIGKLYGAQTSPHIFIINPEGVLVYKGGIDSIPSAKKEDIARADNYVRESLAALAAGKKVANPSTKPYGCSIKYAS